MQAPRLNHALNHDSSGRVNRAPLAIAQLAPLSAAACTAGTDTGAPLRLRGQYKAAGAVPCCRVAGVGVGLGGGGCWASPSGRAAASRPRCAVTAVPPRLPSGGLRADFTPISLWKKHLCSLTALPICALWREGYGLSLSSLYGETDVGSRRQ